MLPQAPFIVNSHVSFFVMLVEHIIDQSNVTVQVVPGYLQTLCLITSAKMYFFPPQYLVTPSGLSISPSGKRS